MSAATRVDRAVVALREAYPDANVTAEMIEGRVVDGVAVEVHGYYCVPLIEVKAATAEGATDLMLSELDRVRSESQSYVWPPRAEQGDPA